MDNNLNISVNMFNFYESELFKVCGGVNLDKIGWHVVRVFGLAT